MLKRKIETRLRIALLCLACAVSVSTCLAQPEPHWVATWASAPSGGGEHPINLNDETLREIVHTTIGGSAARIELSNVFGSSPLTIASAHLALRRSDATIDTASDRVITFSGQPRVVIQPGMRVVSDPIALTVPAAADLAVSLYLPGPTSVTTLHWTALEHSYRCSGNQTATATPAPAHALLTWPFLTAVDVAADPGAGAVAAFGDSITDGVKSSIGGNARWTDILAKRLADKNLAVLNLGIAGNRLLHEAPGAGRGPDGPPGAERFERDVLSRSGIRYVIVLEGINDIAQQHETAANLIAGLQRVVEEAHAKGLKVFLCTITPFEGVTVPRFFLPEKEAQRQQVNQWIRTAHAADGVIDFDAALRDPVRPTFLAPEYDSGDHLHPSERGYQAMGDAVPLSLFH